MIGYEAKYTLNALLNSLLKKSTKPEDSKAIKEHEEDLKQVIEIIQKLLSEDFRDNEATSDKKDNCDNEENSDNEEPSEGDEPSEDDEPSDDEKSSERKKIEYLRKIIPDLESSESPLKRCLLGYFYYYGLGVDVNHVIAHDHFNFAANKGNNPYARYHLGLLFEKGLGVTKHIDTAIIHYTLAAEQGDTVAPAQLFGIGTLFAHGIGVPKDAKRAEELFSLVKSFGKILPESNDKPESIMKAAVLGYELSQKELGNLFLYARDIDGSLSKAEGCYRTAILKGNKESLDILYDLGRKYAGAQYTLTVKVDVKKDLKKAAEIFAFLSEQDHTLAKEIYKQLIEPISWFWDSIENNEMNEMRAGARGSEWLADVVNIPRLSDGMTALHLSVLKDNWETTGLLVEHGGDIYIKNKAGLTAFDLAKQRWKANPIYVPNEPRIDEVQTEPKKAASAGAPRKPTGHKQD